VSIKCKETFGGRGSAPDPTGRAYSAPPDPLAAGEGAGCPLPKNPSPLLALRPRLSSPPNFRTPKLKSWLYTALAVQTLDPSHMTCVLVGFSLRQLALSQALTSTRHASRRSTATDASLDSTPRYNWVSSAHLMNVQPLTHDDFRQFGSVAYI